MKEPFDRLLSGLVGGVVGLVTMRLALRAIAPIVRPRRPRPMDVFFTERSMSLIGPRHHDGEPPAEALARHAYHLVRRRDPSPAARALLAGVLDAGAAVAVAVGFAAIGGRAAARHPVALGAALGLGLWLIGDELALPLLGLADRPTAYHPTAHVRALAGRLGYGVATAATTWAMGRALHSDGEVPRG